MMKRFKGLPSPNFLWTQTKDYDRLLNLTTSFVALAFFVLDSGMLRH